jgi:hypothetical protein
VEGFGKYVLRYFGINPCGWNERKAKKTTNRILLHY